MVKMQNKVLILLVVVSSIFTFATRLPESSFVFSSPIQRTMENEKLEQIKQQVENWVQEAQKYYHKIPPDQLYIAAAIGLATLIILFLITSLFKRKSSNTIILTGLCGSGKTVLFYQIKDGSSHQGTVTSMEPNEDTFTLASETMKSRIKPVHVVDFPGHSRLRPKLDHFLPQAAGVVFVIDAVEFLPNCRAAAEYLYDILTNPSVIKKRIPVLLLCNKVDKVTAHTKEFIRKQLEKEIDKFRASRTAVSSADIDNEFTLGVPGEAFAFSQCNNKIVIGEGSGLTGETSQLEMFIREHVQP